MDDKIIRVKFLKYRCRKLRLLAPAYFWYSRYAFLARCYNGIGSDDFPEFLRDWVTEKLSWYEEQALIHDVDYTLAPKNYFAFTASNIRFFSNSVIEAAQRGTWGKIPLGLALAAICQAFGWRGYKRGGLK